MNKNGIRSLINIRHHLHAHPELSGEEYDTQRFVSDYFTELNPDRIEVLAKTGLLVTFKGKESIKNILIRAEMDALPIQESDTFQHRSVRNGVSHKCGHDGHITTLLGLGDWCSLHPLERTDVHLVFQPAEETGQGARAVIEDSHFDVKPDFCFALHNIPGFKKNEILIREGYFTASVISLSIDLLGRTSHAAEPENGVNPGLAVARILNDFDNLNHQQPASDHFFISTPIFIDMGEEAFGTSAGQARLGFTFRSWNMETMRKMQASAVNILEKTVGLNGLNFFYRWHDEFNANYNHKEAVDLAVKSARNLKYPVRYLDLPFRWGEDFGYFTARFSGAMIGIGAGTDTPALHHSNYDFPDEIMVTGMNLLREIIMQIDNG
jgi:amidohydrolase